MNAMQRQRGALVLVDYQQRLMPTIHDADSVLAEALFLGRVAHALGVPVLGTEQNPLGLGANAPAVRALCTQTLGKMHFDACRDGKHVEPGAAQTEHGLQQAHVRLAAGDDDFAELGACRAQVLEQAVATSVEMHLAERLAAQRAHGRRVGAEPQRVLLGAEHRYAQRTGDAAEKQRFGEHGVGVVDRRHQALLVVDEHERAAVAVHGVHARDYTINGASNGSISLGCRACAACSSNGH